MTSQTLQAAALEETPCPLCGSEEHAKTPYEAGRLAVVRCGSCATYYLSPRLPESKLIECYRDESYFGSESVGYSSYVSQRRSLTLTFRRLLEVLRRRGLTGGSLLEIGCGYGYFLEAAEPFFQRRVATEMSADAAEVAREFADEVYVGGMEAIPGEERFDLVLALHVIEHIYEPHRFVKNMRGRVRKGGALLLAAPDMGSFWRRLLGKRWPSFKFPEHVVFYDRRNLSRLLSEAARMDDPEDLPYPHAFPLSEVLRKLGLPSPAVLNRLSIWIPATTVAMYARMPEGA